MTRMWWDEVRLPIGDLKVEMLLVSDGSGLTGSYFTSSRPAVPDTWIHDPKPLAEARAQLQAYAAGELTEFEIPLCPLGTAFQTDVWNALTRIRFGTTTTYGRLATELGRPHGSRAVGAAVGRNPLGIVVPCHRVIGADGSLTGFGGGLETKAALLRLEGVTAV
jgi:methylated-DNA-[protein]-cysteine S-methyltransferase